MKLIEKNPTIETLKFYASTSGTFILTEYDLAFALSDIWSFIKSGDMVALEENYGTFSLSVLEEEDEDFYSEEGTLISSNGRSGYITETFLEMKIITLNL